MSVWDEVREPLDRLPEMASGGRRFTAERKVRLGDVDRRGRLRLDALTRYTQDVSDDDTTDAGLPVDPGWVVRSTVVDQLAPASLGERLRFVTFCSGLGGRWAERRLTVTGAKGARYEVSTLWVCVDPKTGKPRSLTEQFVDLYAAAAAGRRVSARARNPKPTDVQGDVLLESWLLRTVDYDVFGHVNNAAYWAAVEQWLPPSLAAGSFRARMEYGRGLAPVRSVPVARVGGTHDLRMWWLEPGSSEPGSSEPGENGSERTDSDNTEAVQCQGEGCDTTVDGNRPIAGDRINSVASAVVLPLDPGLYPR